MPTDHEERDENGKLLTRFQMEDGALHGEFVQYGETEQQIAHRAQYQKGKLHGLSITYDPEGREVERSSFEDGVLHGETKLFDENGKISRGK